MDRNAVEIEVVNRPRGLKGTPGAEYIARGGRGVAGSPLANPRRLRDPKPGGGVWERGETIALYERELRAALDLEAHPTCDGLSWGERPLTPTHRQAIRDEMNRLYRLAKRGRLALDCFCAPHACHGDVIRAILLEKLRPAAEPGRAFRGIDFRRLIAERRMEREGRTDFETVLAEVHAQLDAEAAIRAQHHGYLPEPGVPFMHARGVRTRNGTGDTFEVDLVLEVRPSPEGSSCGDPVLRIALGAVTGWESWYVDDSFLARNDGKEMYPCAGGMGWDCLMIPADEMARVIAFARDARGRVAVRPEEPAPAGWSWEAFACGNP